ncbi:PepSY-associated TM helix domain-containing protein [Sphingobacterium lumbrici]|uniref:PepSY-associated TM helix domain-containing protein n=1 Tax=Sphingobacterium lumbrici TaxID=2559600 RepID=UPI00112B2A9B|nr:PepSY-associated TM helix domain-containing protein [Sphingobacterium lumbrici]
MNKSKKTNQQTWPKVRKLFNDLHLWGGLISGIVVFIVCITGTVYVYNTEIREAAAPEYYKVQAAGDKIAPDSLLAIVKPRIEGRIVGIKIPHATDATTAVLFIKPEKNKEEEQLPRGAAERSGRQRAQGDGAASAKRGSGEGTEKRHAHGHAHNDKKEEGEEVPQRKPAKDSLVQTVSVHDKPHTHDHNHGNADNSKRGEGSQVAAARGQAGPAAGGGPRRPRFNQMMVNPYSGEVIGDVSEVKTKTAEFMQKMFGLHRWLLLNEIEEPIIEGVENRKLGSWITGTATLLFLFGVISGVVIWFPNKMRSWKNGLKIKWSAKWKRINHDLHNTLAFYSCIILFLMAVTGPFWSFEWYRAGWQKTWGTYQEPNTPKEEKPQQVSLIPKEGHQPLTVEQTLSAVNDILPYNGDVTINFAKDSIGAISIAKNRVGFFAPSAGDKLTLDQYTGEVLEKDIFSEKPFNERAAASIKALHIGDIYGSFTKLLYFISCIIATSLPVTGVMIWINKMKKRPKKKTISS